MAFSIVIISKTKYHSSLSLNLEKISSVCLIHPFHWVYKWKYVLIFIGLKFRYSFLLLRRLFSTRRPIFGPK